jgi:hypothetical protein
MVAEVQILSNMYLLVTEQVDLHLVDTLLVVEQVETTLVDIHLVIDQAVMAVAVIVHQVAAQHLVLTTRVLAVVVLLITVLLQQEAPVDLELLL